MNRDDHPRVAYWVGRDSQDLAKTAVHEAGHAVAAWFCTAVPNVRLATIEADTTRGLEGFVAYEIFDTFEHARWCSAVISLAGMAAEAKAFGVARSGGAARDLENALKAIRASPGAYPWDHPGKALPFGLMFRTPLTGREVDYLSRAYRTASALLDAHEVKFHRLVSMLLTTRTVDAGAVETILGPRTLIALRGKTLRRAFFVQPVRVPGQSPREPSPTLWGRFRKWISHYL